jgi:hypothetical protein
MAGPARDSGLQFDASGIAIGRLVHDSSGTGALSPENDTPAALANA